LEEIVIQDWCQLQFELFKGSWNESIQRYRSPYVFRGLSDASYRLETSLMRLGGPYVQLEKNLLRNFRKYAQSEADKIVSFWHLLSVAQHHGLPTRLLDWTYSPYVALHFALSNIDRFDIDGVIWIVDFEKTHKLLPGPLSGLLKAEGAQAFTVELLTSLRHDEEGTDEGAFHDVVKTLTEFDRLGDEKDFLLFFEPPSINDRIINQFALFSVMPNPGRIIDSWLNENQNLYKRLIIPAGLKWEFRDKLDQCNITERVLFPGLDGLSSWLKRQYSPKK
jgi:hypothetical protein